MKVYFQIVSTPSCEVDQFRVRLCYAFLA